MPERKGRKSLFSSDDARRKAARVELETEDERYERLRTTRERIQEVRIPKNVDIFVFEIMHRGMRHEEVQKLHVDDLHVFRLTQQGIPVKKYRNVTSTICTSSG